MLEILTWTAVHLGKNPSIFKEGGEFKESYEGIYDLNRESLLAGHYWAFAERSGNISLAPSPPKLLFPFVFKLPKDYISLSFLSESADPDAKDIPCKVYSNGLLSAARNTGFLSYTANVTKKFDPPFVELFGLKMAP